MVNDASTQPSAPDLPSGIITTSIENDNLYIVDFPIKTGDFPQLC